MPLLAISRAVVKGCPARMRDSSHRDKDCPSIVDSRTDNSAFSVVSEFVADGQAKVRVNLLLKFQVYFNNLLF